MLTDFQNSFTYRISRKLTTKSYLNIPSHLIYVATLPCEIWMSEHWWQSEICIVMNDKSWDSTAMHSSCDMSLHCKFITQLATERIVKIGEHLAKLQAKWLIVSYAPFALDFCPQKCRTHRISKITCVWRTETVTGCCYINRQINVRLLSTNIKLL